MAQEMRRQVAASLVAGFGVVAGLAWNEAIKALIEFMLPFARGTLIAKFGYAAVVTVLVVLVTVLLIRRWAPASDKT
ncbi:hypothetical protein HYV74_03800 [Candidatus Uhrbacteria bacterium]|nr:hypothetical protein [Candidatus Uhrbacteria bacterium]